MLFEASKAAVTPKISSLISFASLSSAVTFKVVMLRVGCVVGLVDGLREEDGEKEEVEGEAVGVGVVVVVVVVMVGPLEGFSKVPPFLEGEEDGDDNFEEEGEGDDVRGGGNSRVD